MNAAACCFRLHRRAAAVFVIVALTAGGASAQLQYSVEQTADFVTSVIGHPYVLPTESALAFGGGAGLDAFVIGRTLGTDNGGYLWQEQWVPAQDIYGFRMTDAAVTTPKTSVAIVGGQHPNESHSLYSLEGMVDFILGGTAEAQTLMQRMDFYVYPQVNPEGRWAGNAARRSNPENPGLDNNRVWDDPAGWTNVTIARDATVLDTYGADLGFLFDFHSPGTGTFIFASALDKDSPYGQAIEARGIPITVSVGNAGMVRRWSQTAPGAGGLGVTYAFTPEIGMQSGSDTTFYRQCGEDLALALYDVVSSLQPTPLPLGTVFQVDFHSRLTPEVPGWNVVDAGHSNSRVALANADDEPSTVTLVLPGLSNSSSAGWNAANPLPDWAVIEAADDYVYFNNDVAFLLEGLSTGRTYDFELIASRNLDRETWVTIDGATIAWNERHDGWNSGDVLRFKNVGADHLGNVAVYFGIQGNSGAINAMRITVVPEPGALGLLATGLLATLAFRRSRPRPRASDAVGPLVP